MLAIQNKLRAKSPSDPNLHPGATSMLVLQGSLTAFTAMAAGKTAADKLTRDANQQSETQHITIQKTTLVKQPTSTNTKPKFCEDAECQSHTTTENKNDGNMGMSNVVCNAAIDGRNKITEISKKQKTTTAPSKANNKVNKAFKETRV